jgi:hypothetical protein
MVRRLGVRRRGARLCGMLVALATCGAPPDERSAQALLEPVEAGTSCIEPSPPPPPDVPWQNAEDLCARARRGKPWAESQPARFGPDAITQGDVYAQRVLDFLRGLEYRKGAYSWLHDANWRLTGSYQGCPPCGSNTGPHPAVRIYYSPEVIDWMCSARTGKEQSPGAPPIPDGAVIIKEMISVDRTELARVPGSKDLWIAPRPGKPADWYDQTFDSWTIMIKSSQGAADGWYWAFFARAGEGNPPILARSGFAVTPYPGQDGKPVKEPPGPQWYPTYWNYSLDDVQYPNYAFGNYCVYCHASAQGENTFASFDNILGQEIRYPWEPGSDTRPDTEDHRRGLLAEADANEDRSCAAARDDDENPFPSPRADSDPLPGFQETFPELDPPYSEVWDTRLPAQTWDHAVSRVGVPGVPPERSQFLTSDQCEGCHEAGGSGQLDLPYMVVERDGVQTDLSPRAEWSASPMGLAGRDPIFHAQLEFERNVARGQPGLAELGECVDNLCLHCHGAAGARQYNIDTRGKGDDGARCADFLPPPEQRAAADMDGKLFTHGMVDAWRDEDPGFALYGGLARDGVNCTVCHRIADTDLEPAKLPLTFTGNFRTGPPDTLFGPFPDPRPDPSGGNASAPVLTRPMENALSITPKQGAQLRGSELCGTCHTVFLPVFDDRGRKTGTSYEQTTYLEWLLSDFSTADPANRAGRSCQDCHMPSRYQAKEDLVTGIANIQDTRYPLADFLLPADEVDVPWRPYRRHQLYGLNAFLTAYAQQYPLLLGLRQQDFMNPNVTAPQLTALESVLDVARTQTATVAADAPTWDGDVLQTRVTVQNLGGHSLPSGVGFRRIFVEFLVLDASGTALWASGRTNDIGVILQGTSERALPTEFFQAGPDGLPFQPHHEVVTSPLQVQIYEEDVQDSSLQFTSSFIHRYWRIKDNRLRPRGWNPARVRDSARAGEYGEATRPGTGPDRDWWPEPGFPQPYRNRVYPAIDGYTDTAKDPDYLLSANPDGLPGRDSLLYRIALSGPVRARARTIQVTLYSQSTPPSYLKERFVAASQPGAERAAASRLHYMAGHLNTDARAADGQPYLQGSKLRIGAPASRPIPSAASAQKP